MSARKVVVLLLAGAVSLTAPADAQIQRSRPLIQTFARATGYPKGRPGFVVDHQIPLCAGGPDAIANLQWQPVGASYVKDAFERELCRDMVRLGLIMVSK